MKRYGWKTVSAAAITILMLAGCGSSAYNPSQSGIYVSGDGTVQSAEIESFDNSSFEEERYNEEELQQFVEQTVSTYNSDTCGQAAAYEKDAEGLNVSIVSLEVEDAEAKLILKYSSCDTYLSFNNGGGDVSALSVTAASDAAGTGSTSETEDSTETGDSSEEEDTSEKDEDDSAETETASETDGSSEEEGLLSGMVDGNGLAVDTSSMTGDGYYVITITGSTELTVKGTVKAVSGAATVKNGKTVEINGDSAVILVKG